MNEELKKKIMSISIKDLIDFDAKDMATNLDIKLNACDISMVRDDWTDFESQLDLIKKYIVTKTL